jgi:hypothetical protein
MSMRAKRVGGRKSLVVGAAVCALALVIVPAAHNRASGAVPPVIVFPIPGSHVASPRSQIVIRGLPASQFGAITAAAAASCPRRPSPPARRSP